MVDDGHDLRLAPLTLFDRFFATGWHRLLDALRRLFRRPATPPPPVAITPPPSEIERLQALLDGVGVGLFALAPDGRVEWANRAAHRFAGTDITHLSDIPAFDAEIAATILALPPGGRELVTLGDGRTMLVWVGTFATPDQRTQRLLSIQAMTGALDAVEVEAWHSMTRALAQEMMTSLSPIVSLSESLQRLAGEVDTAPPEVAAAIDTIAQRSNHLLAFVERYRTLADLPEPELAEIDLAVFLAETAALVGPQIHAEGIRFEAIPPLGPATVHADPGQLQEVLINLLYNAADAVAEVPQPEISLSCRAGQNEVAIAVRDNGIGVPPDQIEEIFVPFFSTKPEGSGIGLTLSRQIAIAHRGALTAAPNVDAGMTFTLTLRAAGSPSQGTPA